MNAGDENEPTGAGGRTASLEKSSVVGKVNTGAVLWGQGGQEIGAGVHVARLFPLPNIWEQSRAVVRNVAGPLRLHGT